jgi:hypothetical protein
MRDGKRHVVRALGQKRPTAAGPACQCSETLAASRQIVIRNAVNATGALAEAGANFVNAMKTPALAIKSVRNFKNAVTININRARGREFIPKGVPTLSIETSSLCNLECRFCAYVKKSSAKVTMKDEFFRSCVGQAIDMGYRHFDLTPCTGDVFMDRGIFRAGTSREYAGRRELRLSHQFHHFRGRGTLNACLICASSPASRSASTDMTRRHSST